MVQYNISRFFRKEKIPLINAPFNKRTANLGDLMFCFEDLRCFIYYDFI